MKVRQTLKDTVYNAILNGVITNEYAAGQRINESELIKKYGYSKSPIREALIALCNENVLVAIPRYGYEVVKLTTQDIHDILKFRMILESGCLRESYLNITPQGFKTLSSINEQCINYRSGDDYWKHWDHNTEFHLYLMSFNNNQYAYRALTQSMNVLKRAYAQFYHDKWNSAVISSDVRAHASIISALKKKDIKAACELLEADLTDFGY